MSDSEVGNAGAGGLHERLRVANGERSVRELAALTGMHAETVRRYMQGQSPSVEFLAAVCAGLGVSGEWLLTGRGPMHKREVRAHALRDANVTELLTAMSGTLERLIERVERLEVFLQSLESRLRARPVKEESDGESAGGAVDGKDGKRGKSVADSITRRPPPDAG